MPYDPENWLETAIREFQDYVSTGFNEAVRDDQDDPVGLEIYEIVMEFPGPNVFNKKVPLAKNIIHFEIDEIDDRILGFGDNFFALNLVPAAGPAPATRQPQEAREHRLNLDVGIWASDRTGGRTARMRAKRILTDLLLGSQATAALYEATKGNDGGVEILRFSGGRFITDTINDVEVYRMIDCELELRVFSRTKVGAPEQPIEGFTIEPNLTV